MGCNCGKTPMPKANPVPGPDARAGDWVVVYPSGSTSTFRGGRARQRAQREAIATGGSARQIEG